MNEIPESGGPVEMHGPHGHHAKPHRISGRTRRRVVIGLLTALGLGYLDLLEVHAMLAINSDTLIRAEQLLSAAEAGAKAGLNKTAAEANRASTEVKLREQERDVLRGPVRFPHGSINS